jgi:hypothetical protein
MEELFAKLEKDGKVLSDVKEGNFILTRNDGVVPIDNPAISVGNGPQWEVYARSKRALQNRVLANLRRVARPPP